MWTFYIVIYFGLFHTCISIESPVIQQNTEKELHHIVTQGQSLQLNCHASGDPIPQIIWRKQDGSNLPTDSPTYEGNELQFPFVTHYDFGEYICKAENGVDSSQERIFLVEVEFAPIITETRPLEETNDQIAFSCEAIGYPPPEVTWLKNNHFVEVSKISDSSVIRRLAQLHVKKTVDNLNANYSCRFSNKLGSVERPVYDFHYKAPTFTKNAPIILQNTDWSVIAFDGEPVYLECHATGKPLPKITWRRADGGDLFNGNETYEGNVLEFASVTRTDFGRYICNADNGIGEGTDRNYELIVYIPATITAWHRNENYNNIEFNCSASGYPLGVVAWIRNDKEVINDGRDNIISVNVINKTDIHTTLRVSKISQNINANYSCMYVNRMGITEYHFK